MAILYHLSERASRLDYGLKAIDVSHTVDLSTTARLKFRVEYFKYEVYSLEDSVNNAVIDRNGGETLLTTYTTPSLFLVDTKEYYPYIGLHNEGKDAIGHGFVNGFLPRFWKLEPYSSCENPLSFGAKIKSLETFENIEGKIKYTVTEEYEIENDGTANIDGFYFLTEEGFKLFDVYFGETNEISFTRYGTIKITYTISLNYSFPITFFFAAGVFNAIFGTELSQKYIKGGKTIYETPASFPVKNITFHSNPIGKTKYEF